MSRAPVLRMFARDLCRLFATRERSDGHPRTWVMVGREVTP